MGSQNLIRVRPIANAGLLISCADGCESERESKRGSFLVDALYEFVPSEVLKDTPDRKLPRIAFAPKETTAAMLSGAPPFDDVKAYLFTHLHPDHGNLNVIERIVDKSIPVVLPATSRYKDRIASFACRKIELREPVEKHVFGDMILTAIQTVHDGGSYYQIESYAYFLEFPAATVFIAGDTRTGDSGLREAVLNFKKANPEMEKQIDAAFLNYPEVSRSHGREFIIKILKPKRLFLTHFPPAIPGEKRNVGSLERILLRYADTLPPVTFCDGTKPVFEISE
ncbi:hypothetical protein AGMMS49983_00790 [Clostridia bacterium]|nr:hypothetical protein AGMMS49983_00790 [Clostridia bacterium]